MKKVVTEDQLASADIWRFEDVIAVQFGDHDSGVAVYHTKRLPPFVSAETPAEVRENSCLLVEVEDPDDAVVIERLRMICVEHWRARGEGANRQG